MTPDFDAWLDRFVEAAGPGASVGVELRGRRIYEATRGVANLEWATPVDGQTVFRIASLTKQFTAAAIVRLAEDGRLGLDDPLARWLPAFAAPGPAVTIRQLLAHTSGLGEYTEDPDFMGRRVRNDHTTAELCAVIRALPALAAPGERLLYSNSGYLLLGAVVEVVTGRAYGEHLRETFFEPLGLANTRYLHDTEIVPKRAGGYARGAELMRAPRLASSNPHGAGGLGSTVGDLLAWSRALREGRVVSPAGYAEMAAPGRLNDGAATTRGFGLTCHTLRNDLVIAHGGGIFGFVAHLAHWPAHDLTVAALANSNPFPIDQLTYGLARRALGQPDAAYAAVPIEPAALAAREGRYGFANTEVLELTAAGDGLASVFPAPGSLYRPFGEDRFFLAQDPEVTLRFADDGRSLTFTDYRTPMVGVRSD